jgi:oligopeptide transport system ATP-binding protein
METIMERKKILSIEDLSISFQTSAGEVNVIRGMNLSLYKGETVAIVGESGSGKSVTVKAIMGILSNNGKINSGSIQFTYNDGEKEVQHDLLKFSKKEMRSHINGKRIAMVFQDPMTSLNPTMTVGAQIIEGMVYHYKTHKNEAYQKAIKLLELVGITDPEKRMKNYPHQLSGGMRQRVVIAIALACDPDLLICDEPTTALDVTIQAKILELIKDVQQKRGISVIYITHDLGVVAKVADYVEVMYAGKVIEKGTTDEIFYQPKHPYTWGLLSAMPDLNNNDDKLYTIPGSPPNLLHQVQGDSFAPRNIYAMNIDFKNEPPMFRVSDTHYAATWLLHEKAPKVEMPIELQTRINSMLNETLPPKEIEANRNVNGGNTSVENRGSASERDRGTASERDRGTDSEKNRGTASKENRGTASEKNRGTASEKNGGRE